MRKSITTLMDQVYNIPEAKEILQYYADRAHYSVVYDLIKGYSKLALEDLDFYNYNKDCYMVVVYEDFNRTKEIAPYDLSEVITTLGGNEKEHDHITMGEHEVIVFKGKPAITQFKEFINRTYFKRTPQKGSPMDSLFIISGPEVDSVERLTYSYDLAVNMLNHRFFCQENTHYIDYEAMSRGEYKFIGHDQLNASHKNTKIIFGSSISESVDQLIIYIQTFQRKNIEAYLEKMSNDLFNSHQESYDLKILMADYLLRVKEKITSRYPELSAKLPGNGEIMRAIFERNFLYQIISYFNTQFETMMSFIGSSSSESVLDDIIGFINHNYADDLTLESISPLFGYNSAYLGKIFTKKTGVTFNSYLDSIRITQAKKLLTTENLKVYEVATRVGYSNVDYFHIKFKKYVGMSPAVFKKQNKEIS